MSVFIFYSCVLCFALCGVLMRSTSQAEVSVLLKPFLGQATESELFAIMTGGFASIAGAMTGTIVAFGVSLFF